MSNFRNQSTYIIPSMSLMSNIFLRFVLIHVCSQTSRLTNKCCLTWRRLRSEGGVCRAVEAVPNELQGSITGSQLMDDLSHLRGLESVSESNGERSYNVSKGREAFRLSLQRNK